MARPWPGSGTAGTVRRIVAIALGAALVSVGVATATPASASVDPNAMAPTVTRQDCGNHISAISVRPHAGFNPLTATDDQLIANNLPTRPTGAKNLAVWKHFVTTDKYSMPTCDLRTGHRGHPLHDRPTPHSPATTSPDDVANQHSANWSGNVLENNYYTDAYTYFNVPEAEGTSSGDYYKSLWDGIGQAESSYLPLVQGGVEADFTGNSPHWYLWWEMVPQLPYQQITSYDVHYGDLIYVHSHLSQNDDWVYIINETRGYSGTYEYNTSDISPDNTAEWILERTEVDNDTVYPMLAKGDGTFNSADVKGTSVSYTAIGSQPHYYNTMWNCKNGPDEQLAYPGSINSSGGFTVYTQNYGTSTNVSDCSSW